MATLIQCVNQFIENITVTDRQEENIKGSVKNIEGYLKDKENGLSIVDTFTNGSYERDTIIRPLHDIDLFAVLKEDDWKDEYGRLSSPQSVLTSIKNYLDSLDDYKGKVKQDRPCVTIELSDKRFDILPSFEIFGGGYRIPNYDLKSWIYTYPKQLTIDLNNVNKQRAYKVKGVIKGVKYWNRENNYKTIPSFHIEEIAIRLFQVNDCKSFEEGLFKWFENAEYYLTYSTFKTADDYESSKKRIKKVKDKLEDAERKRNEGKEGDAIQIWKEVFGKDFPITLVEEAKSIGKSLSEGTLRSSVAGLSTTFGDKIKANTGYFGEES